MSNQEKKTFKVSVQVQKPGYDANIDMQRIDGWHNDEILAEDVTEAVHIAISRVTTTFQRYLLRGAVLRVETAKEVRPSNNDNPFALIGGWLSKDPGLMKVHQAEMRKLLK